MYFTQLLAPIATFNGSSPGTYTIAQNRIDACVIILSSGIMIHVYILKVEKPHLGIGKVLVMARVAMAR